MVVSCTVDEGKTNSDFTREGESVRVGPNLCLSAIVPSPLLGYGGIEVASSRHTTLHRRRNNNVVGGAKQYVI